MPRRALVLCLLVLATACRSAAPLPPPSAPTPPAPLSVQSPRQPESIRWIQNAAEYRAIALQTYRLATVHVEAEARGRQAGSWAVILDADETILNNAAYQAERARQGLPFTPESWTAWVRRREATPVPGAAAFLARVRDLGGRIAVVTNRLQSECADTIAVFERYQLAFDAMLCRLDGTASDKNPRFDAVARGLSPASASPLDVVAYMGDNILDFPSLTQKVKEQGDAAFAPFGARYFMLPNPMYGSWE